MSKLKEWVEPTHKNTTAIIAPNLSPSLQKRTKVVWLLQWPSSGGNDFYKEEGELDSENEEVEQKEAVSQEVQVKDCIGEDPQVAIWPKVVYAAVQFNRIASHHYKSQCFSVEAYSSKSKACFLQSPSPESKKHQDWAKIDLFNQEKSSDLIGFEDILNTLCPKMEGASKKEAISAGELSKPLHSVRIVLLQILRKSSENWFEDEFGNDLRVVFSDNIQRNQTLYNSLKTGDVDPINISILKVYFGEENQRADISDVKVGPWLRFSVKYVDVQEFTSSLSDFSVSYLNLNVAIVKGLPFKTKSEGAQPGEASLAVFGKGCTHPALPCSRSPIELQFCSEKDTRISQLVSTCSHEACVLDTLDTQARFLEKSLLEGYILALKPCSATNEGARLYSHVLRMISGRVYLFCLRQVEQLQKEVPVVQTNSFSEYFRLNVIRPSILSGEDEKPGFGLLNPLNSHTTRGGVLSSVTGMASHHSKIPALPSVAAETCWLSQILSTSMGDILYQEKVLASSHIQSIKRLFMSESGASISHFNKHLDELCPSSQEKLSFDSDSLSIIHQHMFLTGLTELIKLWPQVWPNPSLKDFLRDVHISVKNRLGSVPPEIRAICGPLPRPPFPPPKGWNPHFPPGMNPPMFSKHMIPPPPPPFSMTAGFRPSTATPWGNPAARESAHAYLNPDPYAEKSKDRQAEWQSNLGDPDNLLYHYWMARREDNITLQSTSKRQNNDFDARIPPKD